MKVSTITLAWLVVSTTLVPHTEAFGLGLIGFMGLAGVSTYAIYKLHLGQEVLDHLGFAKEARTNASISPLGRFVAYFPKSIQEELNNHTGTAKSLLDGKQHRATFAATDSAEHDRSKRDVGFGFPKINPRLITYVRSIDEQKCLERFFCELGHNESTFGNVGNLVRTGLLFTGPTFDKTWFIKAFRDGQRKGLGACPVQCNSSDLHKMVRYLDKQIFYEEKKTTTAKNPNILFR